MIPGLCFGCWLLPLTAIGIPYIIIRAVLNAWQTRGIGTDAQGLYCAKCRFDLRGGTTMHCSECGSYLGHPPSLEHPRGRILTPGSDPPMHPAMIQLFALAGGFAPVLLVLLLVGLLLPINCQTLSHIDLIGPETKNTQPLPSYAREVNFYLEADPSWGSPTSLEYFSSYNTKSDACEQVYQQRITPREGGELYWEQLVTERPELLELTDPAGVRAEFIDLFVAIAEIDEKSAKARANRFRVEWDSYTDVNYHPFYILFVVMGCIAGLVWLGVVANRANEKSQKAYRDRLALLQERYARVVESSRELMHGKPSE